MQTFAILGPVVCTIPIPLSAKFPTERSCWRRNNREPCVSCLQRKIESAASGESWASREVECFQCLQHILARSSAPDFHFLENGSGHGNCDGQRRHAQGHSDLENLAMVHIGNFKLESSHDIIETNMFKNQRQLSLSKNWTYLFP